MAETCSMNDCQVITKLTDARGTGGRHVYATFPARLRQPPEHLRQRERLYCREGRCTCGCDGEVYRYSGLARDVPHITSETASPEPLDKEDKLWLRAAQKLAADRQDAIPESERE